MFVLLKRGERAVGDLFVVHLRNGVHIYKRRINYFFHQAWESLIELQLGRQFVAAAHDQCWKHRH